MRTECEVTYLGIPLLVKGEYSPSERQTYWHPGVDAEFEVEEILVCCDKKGCVGQQDISAFFYDHREAMRRLTDACIEQIESDIKSAYEDAQCAAYSYEEDRWAA